MTFKACNIGRDIIPFNGLTYLGSPIHIVTYSGDPVCGIFRNQFNFTGQQCIGNGRFGNVIEYNPKEDINCGMQQENLPLDTYTPLLGIALVLTLFRRKIICI